MSDKLQFVVVPAYVGELKFVGHSKEDTVEFLAVP
jgi:hypothetical protein